MPSTMTFKIVSKASDKVLDVAGVNAFKLEPIRQNQDNDSASQLWKVFSPSPSFGFVIQSVASEMNLNVFQASLEDGAPIIQFGPTFALNEQWRFISFPLGGDTGLCHIVSLSSGKRLDVEGLSLDNGAHIVQFGPPPNPLQLKTQLWKFVLAGISSGKPQGVKSQFTGLVLDVEGGSLENGAPIIQFKNHGAPNQRWRFEPVGGGSFKIVSLASEKVLDVEGGSLEDGAPIIQFEDHGSPSQQWQLAAEAPLNNDVPVFKFMNRSSGKVLSVAPGASSQKIVQKSLRSLDVSTGALQWTLFEDPVQKEKVLIPRWSFPMSVFGGDPSPNRPPSARELGLKVHYFAHIHRIGQLDFAVDLVDVDSITPPVGTLVEQGSTVTMHIQEFRVGAQDRIEERFFE